MCGRNFCQRPLFSGQQSTVLERVPPMVPVPIRDWGEAITTSMAQALSLLLAAVPRIIGFVIIVAIGWFIATLIARAVATLLRSVRFNDMAERSGFAGFVANTGVETD